MDLDPDPDQEECTCALREATEIARYLVEAR